MHKVADPIQKIHNNKKVKIDFCLPELNIT